MAINNLDDFRRALVKAHTGCYAKNNLGSMIAGSEGSLWRATGTPPASSIPPTTFTALNAATAGALYLPARGTGEDRVLVKADYQTAAAGHTLLLEDRLAHRSGLVGNTTSPQTVTASLHSLIATENLAARIGQSNYSEVLWYLEWYGATGNTATTPTIAVTLDNGDSDTATVWAAGGTQLPANVATSRRYRILSDTGRPIRSVDTLTMGTATPSAGDIGVTAVRRLAVMCSTVANVLETYDWASLGSPRIEDDACLTWGQLCVTTSTGNMLCALTMTAG
jgi:hypothetical protein